MARKKYYVLLCLLLLPSAAFGQLQYSRLLSGTGFFVNREYVITNAHVVKGCDKVTIKGAVSERIADVTFADAQQDLALIRTNDPPREFAPLRVDIDDLKVGDGVYIIGYPSKLGGRGEYKVAEAKVVALGRNIVGSKGHFYVTDVFQQGNSGGPVFDGSGNVIGVVVAKNTIKTINPATGEMVAEQPVGVGIDLATLKDFLLAHGVYTQWAASGQQSRAQSEIEAHAKSYIVNIECSPKEGTMYYQLPVVR